MEIISSIFYGAMFLGLALFMCAVPYMFFVLMFQGKEKEPKMWMYILSGVITLIVFFIGFGSMINWHKIF